MAQVTETKTFQIGGWAAGSTLNPGWTRLRPTNWPPPATSTSLPAESWGSSGPSHGDCRLVCPSVGGDGHQPVRVPRRVRQPGLHHHCDRRWHGVRTEGVLGSAGTTVVACNTAVPAQVDLGAIATTDYPAAAAVLDDYFVIVKADSHAFFWTVRPGTRGWK